MTVTVTTKFAPKKSEFVAFFLIAMFPIYFADMSTGYDTKYAKSFRHFTREALPRLDNYRNIMSIQAAYRPTLDELHNATVHGKVGPQFPFMHFLKTSKTHFGVFS
jgi:hypothetical protein